MDQPSVCDEKLRCSESTTVMDKPKCGESTSIDEQLKSPGSYDNNHKHAQKCFKKSNIATTILIIIIVITSAVGVTLYWTKHTSHQCGAENIDNLKNEPSNYEDYNMKKIHPKVKYQLTTDMDITHLFYQTHSEMPYTTNIQEYLSTSDTNGPAGKKNNDTNHGTEGMIWRNNTSREDSKSKITSTESYFLESINNGTRKPTGKKDNDTLYGTQAMIWSNNTSKEDNEPKMSSTESYLSESTNNDTSKHNVIMIMKFKKFSRMNKFNEQIWCTTHSAIYIFAKYTLVHTIRIPRGLSLSSVPVNSTNIVVATFYDGLLMINREGTILHTLIRGVFLDVAIHGDVIYGLSITNLYYKTVSILIFDKNTWHSKHILREKSSTYNHITLHGRIAVDDDKMYLNMYQTFSFSIYNWQGRKLATYGQFGKAGSGKKEGFLHLTYSSLLCNVDDNGTALLVDGNNHRLQTCNLKGKFKIISLPKLVRFPADAVLDKAAESLWVVNCPKQSMFAECAIYWTKL